MYNSLIKGRVQAGGASYPVRSRHRTGSVMEVANKLNIKSGAAALIVNAPEGFALDLPEAAYLVDAEERADAVLVFGKDSSEWEAHGRPFIDAARRDAIAYIAYPKARKMGTDLNRDVLVEAGQQGGAARGEAGITGRCLVGNAVQAGIERLSAVAARAAVAGQSTPLAVAPAQRRDHGACSPA